MRADQKWSQKLSFLGNRVYYATNTSTIGANYNTRIGKCTADLGVKTLQKQLINLCVFSDYVEDN